MHKFHFFNVIYYEKIVTIKEDDIFINKVSGEIQTEDIVNYLKENVSKWKKDPVIWDYSDADVSKIRADDFEKMVKGEKSIAEIRAGAKCALVGGKDIQYGMLRVFTTFTEIDEYPLKVKVFRNINEAKEWALSLQD